MKFCDPRRTLIAGLALALNLNAPMLVRAADAKKIIAPTIKAQRPLKMAQVTPPVPDLSTSPTPPAPSGLTPIPQPDNPPAFQASPAPTSPVPAPGPAMSTPAPTPPPTPSPNSQPAPRAPLGLHYGEQERLDQMFAEPQLLPTPTSSPSAPQAPVATSDVDRFGFAPPPGTLGQTYKRRTRLIDDKKHPRIGMVDVYLPEEVDVTSPGLKTKWTGKCWRLESDPLLPGVPHIYEIKASRGDGTEPQYRTVRLIMGRIVDLEF